MEKCVERFLYHYDEALRYLRESERAYEKKDDLIPLYGESKYFYYLLSTPLFSMINEFLNAMEVFLKCLKIEFYSYLDMIEISEALKVVEEVDKLKKIVKIRNNMAHHYSRVREEELEFLYANREVIEETLRKMKEKLENEGIR